MGGERSSTIRQRLAGKICAMCRVPLDYNIWDANPGERLCDKCVAAKAAPTQKPIRVYMSFFLRDGWYCQFLEDDLKTPLPRKLIFTDSVKIIELIRRSGGMRDSAAIQAVENAIANGRGGVFLKLKPEQYNKIESEIGAADAEPKCNRHRRVPF